MSLPVMFVDVRERILRDLEAVFEPELFGERYPGEPLPSSVSIGGDATEPPFEVIVRELPTNVTSTRPSSCPIVTCDFDQVVDVVATGRDIESCSSTALCYVDAVVQALMADPTLGGLANHVTPTVTQAGTAEDGNGGYVAGALVSARIERDWPTDKRLRDAVRAAG